MSASFNKFNQFVEDVAHAVHDLKTGTSHVLKILLTNTAPVATNAVYADISGNELANGNGYTTGGKTVGTITGAQTSGTFTLSGGTNPIWTATGSMGPFRYAVLYNTTPTSPLKPLIGWWDYGASVTLNASETFEVDEVSSLLTLA